MMAWPLMQVELFSRAVYLSLFHHRSRDNSGYIHLPDVGIYSPNQLLTHISYLVQLHYKCPICSTVWLFSRIWHWYVRSPIWYVTTLQGHPWYPKTFSVDTRGLCPCNWFKDLLNSADQIAVLFWMRWKAFWIYWLSRLRTCFTTLNVDFNLLKLRKHLNLVHFLPLHSSLPLR